MLLGDLLSLGRTSSAELDTWLRAQDASLAETLTAETDRRGESIAQFLRIAVSDFLAEAGQEEWTSLISAVQSARDPGAACVAIVTAFRLRLEAVT